MMTLMNGLEYVVNAIGVPSILEEVMANDTVALKARLSAAERSARIQGLFNQAKGLPLDEYALKVYATVSVVKAAIAAVNGDEVSVVHHLNRAMVVKSAPEGLSVRSLFNFDTNKYRPVIESVCSK